MPDEQDDMLDEEKVEDLDGVEGEEDELSDLDSPIVEEEGEES